MKTKKSFLWIAAPLIAVLFFMLTRHAEESAPSVAPEPNFFSFISARDGATPDRTSQSTAGEPLIVNPELKQLFDQHMAAQAPVATRGELEQELDRRLSPLAAGEAKRLLTRYLAYRNALIEAEKDLRVAGDADDVIHVRVALMQQVRTQFFSPAEIQGLFSADGAGDMIAALPAALRQTLPTPASLAAMERAVQQMREKGAGEDEIYRARAAALSPESAARLAAMEREQAAWNSRIASYLAERNNLLKADGDATGAERQEALRRLRETHFSAEEQPQVTAYESPAGPQLKFQ
jgi:lipase chaperone LimK